MAVAGNSAGCSGGTALLPGTSRRRAAPRPTATATRATRPQTPQMTDSRGRSVRGSSRPTSKAVAPTAAPAMPSEAAAADSPLAQARLASDLARAAAASGSGWPSSNPRIRSAWASSRSLALLRLSISISRAMPPNRASRANAPDRPPHTILSIAFLLCACPVLPLRLFCGLVGVETRGCDLASPGTRSSRLQYFPRGEPVWEAFADTDGDLAIVVCRDQSLDGPTAGDGEQPQLAVIGPAPQQPQYRSWVGAGDPFSFDHDLSL